MNAMAFPPTYRKRNYWQISLKTLFLLIALLAIILFPIAVRIRDARNQKAAYDILRSYNAEVWYDYELDWKMKYGDLHTAPSDLIDLASPPGPEFLHRLLGRDFFSSIIIVHVGDTYPSIHDHLFDALRHLRNLTKLGTKDCSPLSDYVDAIAAMPKLQTLWLDGTNATDLDLKKLSYCTEIAVLGLRDTKVTNAGIQNLVSMESLKNLKLSRTRVGGHGSEIFSELQGLEMLLLDDTQFTDDDVRHLCKIPNLTYLKLSRTSVGDKAVEYLARCSQLRTLYLDGTHITEEGLRELSRHSNLTWIDLSNTRLTDKSVSTLLQFKKARIAPLSLEGTDITATGLQELLDVMRERYPKDSRFR